MKTIRAVGAVFAGVLIAATVACSGGGSPAPDSESEQPTKLRLALHWTYPVAEWDGIVVADELGYYEEAGLDVELQFLSGSTATVQAVAAGESDLGLAGPDTILSGVDSGLEFTVVANHLQRTSSGVIAPAASGIESFEDLEGKTVSTAAASPEQAMLRSKLAEAGLDSESDLALSFVDPQAKCTVVLSGAADACTGQNNHHVIQFADEGVDPVFLSFSTEEQPILGHSIFANDAYLADHADAVSRFLEATMRGYETAAEDLDAVVDIYVKQRPETDAAFLLKTLEASHELMYSDRTDEHGWGWMDDTAWQALADSLLAGEVLGSEVSVSEIYTNDYLPEDAWKPQPLD
ncbi:hypothetical protein H490_0113800 [Leucobacter sp. UCD-THU]|jgi:NitT/TauT family transport system substrate-binding protein|uniref:ABC transporter substrate-binding protein n=1 Tax=Leucobacter sp. UCD-THU TaxID=1292023 RepID=UPI00036BB341|nr:ABC transporter substrate-binding protein [Leucobacter sp. UCD-THU]EYT52195.1 hypothetical protein H490_0113800 [Leucobacter sp. UCD-THU]